MTKPNHCIWPIRTHYTFVSTNDYICRILTAAACYSSLQLLPSYILSLFNPNWYCCNSSNNLILCCLKYENSSLRLIDAMCVKYFLESQINHCWAEQQSCLASCSLLQPLYWSGAAWLSAMQPDTITRLVSEPGQNPTNLARTTTWHMHHSPQSTLTLLQSLSWRAKYTPLPQTTTIFLSKYRESFQTSCV